MTKAYKNEYFPVEISERIAVVEFSEGHRHNMWSIPRMRELTRLVAMFDEDEMVRAVVLFSGVGRSFGVGGDFHETSTFTGGEEIDEWIDHIANLYVACLRLDRPVIAAIDGYAIGIGLQIALTTDYRIGSDRCALKMPEFELGIACTFGGFMLARSVGRGVMQNMLMSCEEWSADRALRDNLLQEVVPVDNLLSQALRRARRCADFAPAGFRNTKPHLNADYIEGLEQVRIAGKYAHRCAFAAGAPQQKMRKMLGMSVADVSST